MEQNSTEKRRCSRRQFLKGLPLGIAGAVAISLLLKRGIASSLGQRRQPPLLPEGSIFKPARDPQNKI